MGWFTRSAKTPAPTPEKDNIWVVCSGCKAHVYRQEWDRALKVCPQCSFHDRLTWEERRDLIVDSGTFDELFTEVTTADPLNFTDPKGRYSERAEEAKRKTGMREAIVVGRGRIHGLSAVLGIMDFRFLGGSLGSGTGERILRGAEVALKHRLPYIIFSASGGARMHEGIVSLMQMAKTCAAIARLHQAGIPYISVLTDPTTGGVSASFAMIGDINLAEPRALIGFAGRRVIEQTIKQKLPDGFQTAEYLLEHGFIDHIVKRSEMKDFLRRAIEYGPHR